MKKRFIFLYLIPLFFVSCTIENDSIKTKTSLNEEEFKIVSKFLINTWIDSQFKVYNGETIPNELKIKFLIKNDKLIYSYDENYYASFGNKHFVSNGLVEVYIEKYIGFDGIIFGGIKIDLLNEKGEIIKTGIINANKTNEDLNKDEIIERLKKQVELRDKIYANTIKRVNTKLDYYQWSVRGIFSSKLSYRGQRQDYSLYYDFYYENHVSEDFKEVFLEGFRSKRMDGGITWELREYLNPSLLTMSTNTPKSTNRVDTVAIDSICCD